MWGKRHGNPPYDFKSKTDRSFKDYFTFPVENGYSEEISGSTCGISFTVYVLKQPGDGRGDPNNCF